jgi:glutaredoxin
VYSKEKCRYCDLAVSLLESLGLPYSVIQNSELRDRLVAATGQTTYPFVFRGRRFIGGYTELAALLA